MLYLLLMQTLHANATQKLQVPQENQNLDPPLQIAEDLFNKKTIQSVAKTSYLTDAEKQMRKGTAEIFSSAMLYSKNTNVCSISKSTDNKLQLNTSPEEHLFHNLPYNKAITILANNIANNELPNSDTYKQLERDIDSYEKDIVAFVTKKGRLIGSLDDIIYAIQQNDGADEVVNKITASAKDMSIETKFALTDAITQAEAKYPDLSPATIGMVMKRFLTNKQASSGGLFNKNKVENITDTIYLRKSDFYRTLEELSSSKKYGFVAIEKAAKQAKEDLFTLDSVRDAYSVATASYNKVLENKAHWGDESKFKDVQQFFR